MKRGLKFSLFFIIIFVIILIIFLTKNTSDDNSYYDSSSNNSSNSATSAENLKEKTENHNGCQGSGSINLTSPPRPLEQIAFIQPMGLMMGGHVTPIDHQYYSPYNFKMSSEITIDNLKDVLAPADGIITSIDRMPDFFAVKNSAFKDYRLTLHYTCDLYTIFIHIYQLTPEIEEQVKDLTPGNTKQVSIPIKSGQKIGKANVLDFSLVDNNINLKGFIIPAHYDREPWKIHTVDPYDYFIEPLRSQLIEKTLRKAEPFGGKIDYDIEGKLIGNWFKENTNGYQGIKDPEYWFTHISFSPDAYDPIHIIISLGEYKGEAKQFGIKNNAPDPRDVDINSGIVKYELVEYGYLDSTGSNWDGISAVKSLIAKNVESQVKGVVLVQFLEDRKIRLEVFPDKQARDVSGFTNNANIYER